MLSLISVVQAEETWVLSLISVVHTGGDMGVKSDLCCTCWRRHGC